MVPGLLTQSYKALNHKGGRQPWHSFANRKQAYTPVQVVYNPKPDLLWSNLRASTTIVVPWLPKPETLNLWQVHWEKGLFRDPKCSNSKFHRNHRIPLTIEQTTSPDTWHVNPYRQKPEPKTLPSQRSLKRPKAPWKIPTRTSRTCQPGKHPNSSPPANTRKKSYPTVDDINPAIP